MSKASFGFRLQSFSCVGLLLSNLVTGKLTIPGRLLKSLFICLAKATEF